jgi:hypothetical protein
MPNNAPHNALRAAVNRALANGSPAFVNQPRIRELTADESAALQAFAAKHGRSWKDKLASVYWYNARVWNGLHCLHGLRNDPAWGHEGLQAYRLPKAESR